MQHRFSRAVSVSHNLQKLARTPGFLLSTLSSAHIPPLNLPKTCFRTKRKMSNENALRVCGDGERFAEDDSQSSCHVP